MRLLNSVLIAPSFFLLLVLLTGFSCVTFSSRSSTSDIAALSPLSGPLADCCCDAETVSHNNDALNRLLQPLVVNSTYFSVFQVALNKKCPFWEEDGTCSMRACSVCECDDNEVPTQWKKGTERGKSCVGEGEEGDLKEVDRALEDSMSEGWEGGDDEMMWTAREKEENLVFVDLRRNKERYTGYNGESARRIWRSIYEENCFAFAENCKGGVCTKNACKEERVLYRLISGLHTSINMHIAKDFLFRDPLFFTQSWKPNVPMYVARIKSDPTRIENLYFTFALILRAVSKASASLSPEIYSYTTGDVANDAATRTYLKELFQHPLLAPGCASKTFDESDMFASSEPSAALMLSEFKGAFRNISTIMDCTGCEKCRLWGKLQFLGIGTALRILFEKEPWSLQRNEVIALFNLMYKLSTSVKWVGKMESMIISGERWKFWRKIILTLLLCCSSALAVYVMAQRRSRTSRASREKSLEQELFKKKKLSQAGQDDVEVVASDKRPRRRRAEPS